MDFEEGFVYYEPFLLNTCFEANCKEKVLFICKNPSIVINIFEVNIIDGILDEIIFNLNEKQSLHHLYVLASKIRFLALNATNKQVTKGLNSQLKVNFSTIEAM